MVSGGRRVAIPNLAQARPRPFIRHHARQGKTGAELLRDFANEADRKAVTLPGRDHIAKAEPQQRRPALDQGQRKPRPGSRKSSL